MIYAKRIQLLLLVCITLFISSCSEPEFFIKRPVTAVDCSDNDSCEKDIQTTVPAKIIKVAQVPTKVPKVIVPAPVIVQEIKPEVVVEVKPEVVVEKKPEVVVEVEPQVAVEIEVKDDELAPVYFKLKKKVEHFKLEKTKMHVIWVMDDSGSMGDEQKEVAENSGAFISQFVTYNLDFNMAIITTDNREKLKGKPIGGLNTLSSLTYKDSPETFISNFKKNIKVGAFNEAFNEAGYEATEAFMQSKDGKEFLNDKDAYTILIYVSDEDDHSKGKLVADYVNKFKKLSAKNNRDALKIYSIVHTDNNNLDDVAYNHEELGSRYIEGSELTGGKAIHIRDGFNVILDSLRKEIMTLADSYTLEEIPTDAGITVKVAGNTVADNKWEYDSKTRRLKFEDSLAGENVTVTYYTQIN